MFGAPGAVAPARQQRPHPARRDPHPRRLRQVGAQPIARPRVEQQPQLPRRHLHRPLQRRQVRRIGSCGPPRPRRIGQGGVPARHERGHPPHHRALRPATPPRHVGHRLPERHALDHLQPLPHARRQVPPPQRGLDRHPRLPRLPRRGHPPRLFGAPTTTHPAPPAQRVPHPVRTYQRLLSAPVEESRRSTNDEEPALPALSAAGGSAAKGPTTSPDTSFVLRPSSFVLRPSSFVLRQAGGRVAYVTDALAPSIRQ